MLEVTAARFGAKVLYITKTPGVDVHTHAQLHADEIDRVVRCNGAQEIRYTNGGRIVYLSPKRNVGRGYSADIISVPEETTQDSLIDLIPSLQTSQHGRFVIRFTDR